MNVVSNYIYFVYIYFNKFKWLIGKILFCNTKGRGFKRTFFVQLIPYRYKLVRLGLDLINEVKTFGLLTMNLYKSIGLP